VAKQLPSLDERLSAFIEAQPVFFVASAARGGRVNLSPKGRDTLRVLAPNRVAWLNLTGSGNETAAHVLDSNRITLMFCAFEGPPLILRLYGEAAILHPGEPNWDELIAPFPHHLGVRQLFDVTLDLVQTSCGLGVPLLDIRAERDTLERWAERKGRAGVEAYWREHNALSIDGLPTDMAGTSPATSPQTSPRTSPRTSRAARPVRSPPR
jgi:hypothetical protein